MQKQKSIILDLCGGTGAWSKPYKEAGGYDVRVLTLPKVNVTEIRCREPYFGLEYSTYDREHGPTWTERIQYSDICGILAAPPCAEFSIAKGARPRDLSKGMEVVAACMTIIWAVRSAPGSNLKFWALENPRGLLRQFLGIPKFTFEQWQYGGNKRKVTDIWGYFNPPVPTVKEFPIDIAIPEKHNRTHAADWSKLTYPPEYEDYIKSFHGDARRAAARAITPAGFAKAFYRANNRAVQGIGDTPRYGI
jgi:hypothetical protein